MNALFSLWLRHYYKKEGMVFCGMPGLPAKQLLRIYWDHQDTVKNHQKILIKEIRDLAEIFIFTSSP
jgi:hypothetical protein